MEVSAVLFQILGSAQVLIVLIIKKTHKILIIEAKIFRKRASFDHLESKL
jgi:hypothetical protein